MDYLLHENIIVLRIQRRKHSINIFYSHNSSVHHYPIRRLKIANSPISIAIQLSRLDLQSTQTETKRERDLASFVSGVGRGAFESSFESFDWSVPEWRKKETVESFWLNIKEMRMFRSKIEFWRVYCLSKLSIFRDLCSIRAIMASALSASTCSSAILLFRSHCDLRFSRLAIGKRTAKKDCVA